MGTLSRRDVLKVAGAAGVVPLLGAGPRRRHRGTPVWCDHVAPTAPPSPTAPYTRAAPPIDCELVIIKNGYIMSVRLQNPFTDLTPQDYFAGTPYTWRITYENDGAGNVYTSSALPLVPSEAKIYVPAQDSTNTLTFTKHKFTITTMKVDGYVLLEVRCQPIYHNKDGVDQTPQLIGCCYKCGNQELCIGRGNWIVCNNNRVCCP